ncbi:MAG: cob(I)yrinic acid a,c-diamide adenosyltransferase [Candidatus Nanohaloarchaeota archaeon QJJ-9]|nr:cob(I)yrinic acid a,c-diamide adenosyltransferase [Candidatus Nanohaloarchaeota archaeon QJJ-9]
MSIYTGEGDQGYTSDGKGGRVSKDSARWNALGAVDELNSVIGVARSFTEHEKIDSNLKKIQNHLHRFTADLISENREKFSEESIGWVEDTIDEVEKDLPGLESFILMNGCRQAAQIFNARAVCRRAERRIINLKNEEGVEEKFMRYINRLSDLLFVLGRLSNHKNGFEEETPDYMED